VKSENYTEARKRLAVELTALAGINATHPAETAKLREAFMRAALRLAEVEVAHRQRWLQKTDRLLAGLPPHGAQEAPQRVFPPTATIEGVRP
jgi:hypothetical protein